MSFLNPTHLWALMGLAVPLAIHLWSKKEGRTIKIGSISLLRESDPKQTSNLKLNELLLLLLRLLIITILVLILAEPYIKKEEGNASLVYIVEPSLLEDNEIRKLADSLDEASSVKLFSPGFPDYEKDKQDQINLKVPDYWQLTREIDNLPTDSIVVFTNAFQKGFKGKVPEIGRNINWVILDPGMPETFYIEATIKRENVELISVAEAGQNLEISKKNLPLNSDNFSLNKPRDSIFISSERKREQLPLRSADSLQVAIFYAEDFSDEMRFIRSSYSAIGKYIDRPIKIQTFQNEDSLNSFKPSAVVWLNGKSPLQTDAPMLIYKPDSLSDKLVVEGPSENLYRLTGRLNSENIFKGNLSEKLLSMLNLHPGLEENLQKVDQRVMDREDLLPIKAGFVSEGKFIATTALTKYLWILMLLLLIAERGLARYRKQ